MRILKVLSIILVILGIQHAKASDAFKIGQIPLLGTGIYAEGIAYSSKRSTYFVSSAVGGSIQEIGKDLKAKWFQENNTDGRFKALGLKVDDQRDRLWVVGNDAVYIYDLNGKKLLKKIVVSSIGDYGGSFLNDIALDDFGSAYITDSFQPNIFKVNGSSLEMTLFLKTKGIKYGTIENSPWNLNGVVLSPNRKDLIIGKTNDGTLWRVNIETKKISQIKLSSNISFVDGMVWGNNNDLYFIRNFKNKISKISYNENARVQKVVDLLIDEKNFKIPTNAVFKDGKPSQLIVVNSQFEKTPTPFFLTVIDLK